jgi:hypothetical protein
MRQKETLLMKHIKRSQNGGLTEEEALWFDEQFSRNNLLLDAITRYVELAPGVRNIKIQELIEKMINCEDQAECKEYEKKLVSKLIIVKE